MYWWIFIVLHLTNQILSFQDESQSSDSQNLSMSNMSAQFPFPNQNFSKTCQLSTGEKIPTLLNSSSEPNNSSATSDPFLLQTCYECFMIITDSKIKLENSRLDYNNRSAIEEACKSINGECVNNVRQCCTNASLCCVKQLKAVSNFSENYCPVSWDGLLCIGQAKENVTIKTACPTFIDLFNGKEFAEKRCFANATNYYQLNWHLTNYTACYIKRIENELLISQIKRYFLVISLCLLLISILIFISFKSLRSQQRIKVHINLFITLSLRCIFELIITDSIITMYSLMVLGQDDKGTFLKGSACNWVTILLKYFQNCTFNWMLCEALLLYQLLFRTFEHISGISLYLFIGWSVPLFYTGIYFSIRRFHPNYRAKETYCGVEELPHLEYLIRGPNILVLLLNIVFLINIIRLIRNLPTQPYDTSYWRRTLKAVLVLVPLFGLQLLLVAFSLTHENRFYLCYTIFQNIVQDSQGIAVALAFCAFNQEVLKTLRENIDVFKCRSNIRLPNKSNSKQNIRKHGSLNSRSLQRSSNSLRLSARDSVEHNFKIYDLDHGRLEKTLYPDDNIRI